MNTIAIIELTRLVLELASKYVQIAQQQNGELTDAQSLEFKRKLAELRLEPYMQIESDPE